MPPGKRGDNTGGIKARVRTNERKLRQVVRFSFLRGEHLVEIGVPDRPRIGGAVRRGLDHRTGRLHPVRDQIRHMDQPNGRTISATRDEGRSGDAQHKDGHMSHGLERDLYGWMLMRRRARSRRIEARRMSAGRVTAEGGANRIIIGRARKICKVSIP